MKKNIKKIVISLLIIGIVATLAIGFAGCEKNLDGTYIETPTAGDPLMLIKIKGDRLQIFGRDSNLELKELRHETTFTRDKDIVTLDKKYLTSYDAFTITKGGNLTISYTFNGNQVTENYQKQK